MIQRILLTSSGVLLLGSAGAFFLFVPVLSIMTVGSMLVALALMFGLGFRTGTQEVAPSVTVGGQLTTCGYPRRLFLQLQGWKTAYLQRSRDRR